MVMDNGQNILSDHNCVSFSLPKMNCSSRPIFAEGAPCREKPIGEKLSLPRGINQGYQMCPSVRLPSTVMRMILDTVVRNPVDFWTHVANGGLWFGAGVNVTRCQVCCGPNPTGVVCVRPVFWVSFYDVDQQARRDKGLQLPCFPRSSRSCRRMRSGNPSAEWAGVAGRHTRPSFSDSRSCFRHRCLH